MLDAYAVYIQARRDCGGCFLTSLALEFDGRPGAIRDRLQELRDARTAPLEGMLQEARELGELSANVDIRQLAFEAITLTLGANVDDMLSRDAKGLQALEPRAHDAAGASKVLIRRAAARSCTVRVDASNQSWTASVVRTEAAGIPPGASNAPSARRRQLSQR